jgi:hypothetical protein
MDYAAPGIPATPAQPARHARPTRGGRARRNLLHLALDIAIGAGTVLLLSFRFTGLLWHEWLGLAIIPALVVHLLLNWEWVAATARRTFRRMTGTLRFSAVLNTALFVAMTLVSVSGVLISEAVVPGLAIGGTGRGFWRFLHTQSANATLLIVGLHIALHWRWILQTVRQGVRGEWLPGRRRAVATAARRNGEVAR